MNNKKEVISWALYDWANSAFTTAVMAGFFPILFNSYWSDGIDSTITTARLGVANSIAGITVALIAPIIGAIADKGSSKKKFLSFFAYMGVVMTLGLYLVSQGNWLLAVILYVIATIGFSGANIFYDSLLPHIASEKKIDFVSALGYSLGYLGGGLLFAVNVWMAMSPETFGFTDSAEAAKCSLITVGIWWGVFTIPVLIFVNEPQNPDRKYGFAMVKAGLNQFRNTFKELRHLKTIFLFLVAYWLYIDGVDTIVRMAVNYGISIGFEQNDLILALLITQFVGFPSAIGFGYLGTKIGAKNAIFICIAVYLFVSIWGAFIQVKQEFYILAICIGLVQGGIQALSRSFYAKIIPVTKSAEFFGFFNMLSKFAVVIGPILMAGFGLFIKSLGYSSDTASRVSISSISLLFIAGAILLFFVNENKGKEEIKYLA